MKNVSIGREDRHPNGLPAGDQGTGGGPVLIGRGREEKAGGIGDKRQDEQGEEGWTEAWAGCRGEGGDEPEEHDFRNEEISVAVSELT